MHISSFHIQNYKSFLSSGQIKLSSGFNVIVGKNNVGKTALVEALTLRTEDRPLENKPHQSLKTVPNAGATPPDSSQITIVFEVSGDELKNILVDKLPNFYVPIVPNVDHNVQKRNFTKAISGRNILTCSYQNGNFISAHLDTAGYTVDSTDLSSNMDTLWFSIRRPELEIELVKAHSVQLRETLPFQLANILRERIYCFRAERLNVGQSPIAAETNLKPDASNLAQVLHYLQSKNPSRFQKLIRYVTSILPEVKYITSSPMRENSTLARIAIWPVDIDTERDDLAIPLQESGTGIGQVLAILYVVLTSDYPRIIIIDEPQSFLHPGAIRKLVGILRQNYSQHQYIIATHSPTVVTSANPQIMLLVRKEKAESVIDVIDIAETQELRLYLSEIGARLADVFGADDILWVEGRTEELCFPLIFSQIAGKALMGTTILGVRQTGDFEGKHAQTIFDIYQRLSEGRRLLPPAIGFIFDQEGRSQKEQADLKRQSKDKETGMQTVHFLPRRMYENYLLNPQAIAAVTSTIERFRETALAVDEVKEWLNNHCWDTKYFERSISEEARTDQVWLQKVHGAKVLADIFNTFSETRVTYDKIIYGVALTEWLIANAPGDLREISDLLDSITASHQI
jgi:predicted ATPase